MNDLVIKSVLSGVCFGLWPFFMHKSGLGGYTAAAYFSIGSSAILIPFMVYEGGFAMPVARWSMVAGAAILGGLGLLFFNSMLAGAPSARVGNLFVLMTVVQIAAPAIYQVCIAGHAPFEKIAGFIAAGVAAYLLLK